MMQRGALVLLVVVACAVGQARASQDHPGLSLDVSTYARAFRPGGVVLLTVTPSRVVTHVDGTAFDRTLDFWPAGRSRSWQTLAGIPLATEPGRHEVALRATTSDGETTARVLTLTVAPAQFATRRLRVDPRFVNPPASALERIARDAQVLNDLFTQVRSPRTWAGPFRMPVPGTATSSFGRLSILNGQAGSRHQGTDFRATTGTPVRAPNAGEVVLAEDLYYAGNTIVLDHGGGLFSLFAHFSSMAVSVGAHVSRGDLLGRAGATGRVSGPHVHWAVRLRGDSVDPLALTTAVAAAAPAR
jgi:murein DD-endopeptidase MepM/ murein hydrolase activator NlpD